MHAKQYITYPLQHDKNNLLQSMPLQVLFYMTAENYVHLEMNTSKHACQLYMEGTNMSIYIKH